MSVPKRDEYDRTEEWIAAVADVTNISEDVLWDIAEELRPGISAVIKDKATLLRRLLEHHTLYMQKELEDHGQPDFDCKVQLFADGSSIYELQYPTHNIIGLDNSRKEILSEVIAEEEMSKQAEGDQYVAAVLPKADVDEEVRVINRILKEVHGTSIDDVERAIEIRGQDQYLWTNKQKLDENIQQASTDRSQSDQDLVEQRYVDDETEYNEWIFCQNCGDRITDPDSNPRFCSNCRG